MSKKPKPLAPRPSIVGLVGRGWRRTPQAIKYIGYVGTVAGAVYAISQAAPVAEPFAPAHHAWVREILHEDTEPLLQRVVEMQIAQNDGRRQRLLDEAAQRELELQSDQAKQLPQYRALVQQRVDRIKTELNTIDKQNESLFKEKKIK